MSNIKIKWEISEKMKLLYKSYFAVAALVVFGSLGGYLLWQEWNVQPKWKLVFADNFEREELGPDWMPCENIFSPMPEDSAAAKKLWTVRDGKLVAEGQTYITCNREFTGDLRMEFDACMPESNVLNDGIHCFLLANKFYSWGTTPAINSKGYCFAFGANKCSTSYIGKLGVRLISGAEGPKPGEWYHFRVERLGESLNFIINEKTILSSVDAEPIQTQKNNSFGLYNWSGKVLFDNIKIYRLAEPFKSRTLKTPDALVQKKDYSGILKEEEVTFQNGNVTLSGALITPSGSGPFPVFIWCHGSGPATRGNVSMFARNFIKSGYALLSWDKPGLGKSSGIFYQQSLTTRAQEVLAAVAMLRIRSDIDADRISFCGASQAGYVLPRVIKAFPRAEKLVLIGPGSWSFGEERVYQKQSLSMPKICALVGITDRNEIDEVAGLYKKVECASDADFYEVSMQFNQEVKGKAYCQKIRRIFAPPPETPLELSDSKRMCQELFNFNAVQEYAGIPCPTLIMFGENDECVDPKVGIRNIQNGFKKSGNSKLTVKVYPGAGHGLNGAGDRPAQDLEEWLSQNSR